MTFTVEVQPLLNQSLKEAQQDLEDLLDDELVDYEVISVKANSPA